MPPSETPQTWHYGLVAQWWSEFNEGGPEIAYFRRFIESDGQPALDVGCGTGRLLLPYLRMGLDVDGCDVSSDMVALCSERAAREGLSPTLLVQPMHDLDPPRSYRTIFSCGAFGLGSTRAQDRQALDRFYAHLEPGGTLVVDCEVPYANRKRWRQWVAEERARLPEPWPVPGDFRRASDGADYRLSVRAIALDPLEQCLILEMRAEMWRDGELLREERHTLTERFYFRNELLLMLDAAGYVNIDVRGGHGGEKATADDEILVFIARKP